MAAVALGAAAVLASGDAAGAVEVDTGATFAAAWVDGSVTAIGLTADITLGCGFGTRGRGSAALVVDGRGHTITSDCADGGGTIQAFDPTTLADLTILGPVGPHSPAVRGNAFTLDGVRIVGRNAFSTIYNGGELLIRDSEIEIEGSAVAVESAGDTRLERSRITGSGTGVSSGGVGSNEILAIVDSSIDVIESGVRSQQRTVVERSSIHGELVTLSVPRGSVVTDSTLVVGPGTDTDIGGGVRIGGSGDVLFDHVTVVPVDATTTGPGASLTVLGSGTRLTLHASVVVGRAGRPACAGPVVSEGDSVSSDDSCGLAGPGDRVVVGGGLEPYDPAAGVARPLPDGPLVDAVDDCRSGSDQRGVTRPQGPACDIGAVELAVDVVPPSTAPPVPGPRPAPPATPVVGPARFTG